MSAVTETLAIFVGVDSLALPYLIATGKLRTRKPGRTETTVAEAVRVASPVPALAAGKPALLTAVPEPTTTIVAADERTRRNLPRLRPIEQTRNPKLAEFARGRERDPKTGHFLKREAS